MDRVNFAIIGAGRIGVRHAEHISNYANLVAVCDIKPERAKETGEKYKVPYFRSSKEMLGVVKDIEVVSVCSPNGLHTEHTLQALENKKHVLCEKPMALTGADAQKMIDVAHEQNRKLFVVKQNRFNPPIAELKRVLMEKRLGKILSVQINCFWNRNEDYYASSDWKGKLDLDGGTLFTQFSHFIDLVFWLFGDMRPMAVISRNDMHYNIVEFEDSGAILLEFESGAFGTIHFTVNSYGKNMEGSITVMGQKGTVKVGGQYLNLLEYQHIENYEITDIPTSRPANDYGFYQGSMSNHDKVIQNVVDVLRNNAKIATNGYEGKKTVEFIEQVYKMQEDQWKNMSQSYIPMYYMAKNYNYRNL